MVEYKIIPKRSTLHRVAAISLFRALLSQCRAVPLAEKQRNELQNIVRNRFKELRHDQSPRRLKLSFQAGYEAIDHLDAAAAGSEHSKSYICTLLERAPERAKRTPPRPKRPAWLKKRDKRTNEEDREPKEARPSIFDRPLPLGQLSGRRHVPVLFNANGIPVLRIKKPQPQNLSGYLTRRIARREKLHEYRHLLDEASNEAALEDQWDHLIAQLSQLDEQKKGPRETTWWKSAQESVKYISEALDREQDKNRMMAQKMLAVVDRERALYEKEEAERKRAKGRQKSMDQSSGS